MPDLIPVSVREANQDFSGLIARVEERGEGYLVTKRGRPVARILPVEQDETTLTPEQRAALDDLFAEKLPLGMDRLDRDALHER